MKVVDLGVSTDFAETVLRPLLTIQPKRMEMKMAHMLEFQTPAAV